MFFFSESLQRRKADLSSGEDGSRLKIHFKVTFQINFKETSCAASLHAVMTILSRTKPDNRTSSGH